VNSTRAAARRSPRRHRCSSGSTRQRLRRSCHPARLQTNASVDQPAAGVRASRRSPRRCPRCRTSASVDRSRLVGWVEPFAKPNIFATTNDGYRCAPPILRAGGVGCCRGEGSRRTFKPRRRWPSRPAPGLVAQSAARRRNLGTATQSRYASPHILRLDATAPVMEFAARSN
jgi:hypothetical protein